MFLTTDFKPMLGGVADHLHRLAHHLAERMPVTVLTSAAQNGTRWDHAYGLEPLDPLPERRLGFRAGDSLSPVRKLHTGAYFLALRRYADRSVARVNALAADGGAAVVGIWDTAAHFWCEACRRSGVPYYMLAHGVELVIPLYGRLPSWRATDFSHATRVIANSRATADLVSRRLGLSMPAVVVNPSVGPRPPAELIAARAAKLREQLGSRTGPVVMTLGRLVPRKGCDLAIRSVVELRSDFPGLTYLIAGDGPERAALETLVTALGAAGHVRLLGEVDELTKWALYDLCDLFVMPNRLLGGDNWEGFGIVFLEAALSGRPSVGGRTGGASDAIVDEETGLLVDPEQPGELTSAIHRLLADDTLRNRLGCVAAERARTQFSGTGVAASLRRQLDWN